MNMRTVPKIRFRKRVVRWEFLSSLIFEKGLYYDYKLVTVSRASVIACNTSLDQAEWLQASVVFTGYGQDMVPTGYFHH